MNSQNVYVNDSARFNASQNSPPKHGTADENQYKNFSEESEYVKIDVIGSQNKKIEQEGTALGLSLNCTYQHMFCSRK